MAIALPQSWEVIRLSGQVLVTTPSQLHELLWGDTELTAVLQ